MGIKSSKYQVHPDPNIENNVCRICYMNNNLTKFCDCKGSIEYMHRECLLKWIKRSKSLNCELCKSKYNIKLTKKELKKIKLYLNRNRNRVIVRTRTRNNESSFIRWMFD